ncbi:UDP-N-acetylmuramate dehydrogenase [Acidipila sp. EB88]|nr:UDP-N-acetylmuramate dehydrogenase [Acidipila sp. EB88]
MHSPKRAAATPAADHPVVTPGASLHDTLPQPTDGAGPGFPLREQVLLAPYTTFGIGGPARWFASVATEQQLAAACQWARRQGLPLFVLGGGSNVLVADSGFAGLVLHIALLGVQTTHDDAAGTTTFAAAAGEDWDALVARSVGAGCAGMECLAGIPGTVGGTPVQNVGAYGQEVAQCITSVRCYDREGDCFVCFPNEQCGFAYRTSRFNTAPDRGRYVVTSVEFALHPGAAPSLAYADVQRFFADRTTTPSLPEVAEAIRTIRRAKGMVIDNAAQPARDPDTRSAGSFFKNPVVAETLYRSIAASVAPANTPSYPAPAATDGSPQRKLPAAWLLEQAGFPKGFRMAGAAISSKHTLALTNHSGEATAAEVIALRDALATGVKLRFGVQLEQEPISVG